MEKPPEIKAVLWENLRALMVRHYGAENLNRLSREAGVGLGSVARIKGLENSTGLDLLDALAQYFKIDVCQLLTPGFDPARPVKLPTDKDRRDWLGAYDRLNPRRRRKLLDMAEEFQDQPNSDREAL